MGIDSHSQVFCEEQDSLKAIQRGHPVDLGVRVQEIATSPILCTDNTVMREIERERSPLNKSPLKYSLKLISYMLKVKKTRDPWATSLT